MRAAHTNPLPQRGSVRALILRPILDHFAEEPGKRGIMLHRAGLSSEIFLNPYAAIPLATYLSLFEDAAKLADDPILGARLGFGTRPGNLAPMGLRAVQASTIRRGLEAMMRATSAVQSGTQVALHEEAGQLILGYLITAPVNILSRQDTEFTFAGICRLIRSGFDPRWKPAELHFSHPPPRDHEKLDQLFGVHVQFSQPSNRMILRADEADHVHREEDPDMIDMIDRHLSDLMGVQPGAGSLSADVHAVIDMLTGLKPVTVSHVAAVLKMSPRSLQRRLAEEGRSFHEIAQSSRQQKAETLLQDTDLSIDAIASTLGYADGTAFWRAYHRWTGHSPSTRRHRRPSCG